MGRPLSSQGKKTANHISHETKDIIDAYNNLTMSHDKALEKIKKILSNPDNYGRIKRHGKYRGEPVSILGKARIETLESLAHEIVCEDPSFKFEFL